MSVQPAYPLIEGFWIRNYKSFRQIAIGASFQQSVVMDFACDVVPYELSPFTLFAGDSGTGKSTLLDVFAFLADCINLGIHDAISHRGGFESIYHFGGNGPISLGVVYRPCAEHRSLTYMLNIDRDKRTRLPYIETEAIIYREHQPGSQPRPILLFQNGEKQTRLVQHWVKASGNDLEQVRRTDPTHLALTTLAQFEDLPDVPYFKRYLDKFFVANYLSSNAAGLSPTKFKIAQGRNLAHDLKRIKDKHPVEFTRVLDIIAKRLPDIEKIELTFTEAGRSILTFRETGRESPVYPAQLGEGTLRLLSHMMLFEDPIPTPLMGIEEPTAFMGPSQIVAFVQLVHHHVRELGGSQFFVTTSNNMLIDQTDPTDVWFLTRDTSGSIQASRGLDELQFLNIDLNSVGPYWYSRYIYSDQSPPGLSPVI